MAVFVIWLQPTASMSAFSGVKVNLVNALLLRQQRFQHRWLIGLVLLLLVVFVANLLVGPVALSRLLAGDAAVARGVIDKLGDRVTISSETLIYPVLNGFGAESGK